MSPVAIPHRPLVDLADGLAVRNGQSAMVLRRYVKGDERAIDLRPDFAAAYHASGRTLPCGPRWTVCGPGGRPMAVGGLEPLGDRTWGAWGLAGVLTARHWAFVRRSAAAVLELAERDLEAREISAMAHATPEAISLLQRLGFHIAGAPVLGPDGAPYVHMIRRF